MFNNVRKTAILVEAGFPYFCYCGADGRGEDDLTTILTSEEVPPTSLLLTLGFITMVERVELCPPFGRVHLGRPPCQGSWRCGQEGGLRPDRRDLGAMEEQDEGSIGRSPNLSFRESESFFSNGQPV